MSRFASSRARSCCPYIVTLQDLPSISHGLSAREEWILGEYLLSVGQRRASERLAFVLLDLFRRVRRAGFTRKNKILLPVTHSHLSDTIGFSLVHTNKSLQRLRRAGCFA